MKMGPPVCFRSQTAEVEPGRQLSERAHAQGVTSSEHAGCARSIEVWPNGKLPLFDVGNFTGARTPDVVRMLREVWQHYVFHGVMRVAQVAAVLVNGALKLYLFNSTVASGVITFSSTLLLPAVYDGSTNVNALLALHVMAPATAVIVSGTGVALAIPLTRQTNAPREIARGEWMHCLS